ncbi:MAG TPA: FCD domain-containing protein [Microbacteriaceae bacterium]|nr:FCD domain-containing protein [Microbacteriaceae bacterium]
MLSEVGTIDAATGETMMDEIAERLHELRERLGPGARLPAERELATSWGISRVTLRDRISQLESLGLLERRGTAGTYTRDIEPSDLVRMLSIGLRATPLADPEMFESVRIALDRQAALLAAQHRRPVPLAHIEEAVRVMETSTDPEVLFRADREFHRALILASEDPGLVFFAETVDDLVGNSLRRRGAAHDRARHRDDFVHMHRGVIDAIQDGDPARVIDAVERHYTEFRRLPSARAPRTDR